MVKNAGEGVLLLMLDQTLGVTPVFESEFELVFPIEKAYSDAQRKASLEARRRKFAAKINEYTVAGGANPLSIKRFLGKAATKEQLEYYHSVMGGVDPHRFFDSYSSKIQGTPTLRIYPPPRNKIIMEVNGDKSSISRIFSKNERGELEVTHDNLEIPEEDRKKGVASDLYREALQSYRDIGVKRIHLSTVGSSGGYIWSRMGFAPKDKQEMDKVYDAIKKKAQRLVDAGLFNSRSLRAVHDTLTGKPEDVWKVADMKGSYVINGKKTELNQYLMEGLEYDAKLELTDDKHIHRFVGFLNRKARERKRGKI